MKAKYKTIIPVYTSYICDVCGYDMKCIDDEEFKYTYKCDKCGITEVTDKPAGVNFVSAKELLQNILNSDDIKYYNLYSVKEYIKTINAMENMLNDISNNDDFDKPVPEALADAEEVKHVSVSNPLDYVVNLVCSECNCIMEFDDTATLKAKEEYNDKEDEVLIGDISVYRCPICGKIKVTDTHYPHIIYA